MDTKATYVAFFYLHYSINHAKSIDTLKKATGTLKIQLERLPIAHRNSRP